MNLEEVKSLESNCFKSFVDLTTEITDHKIKLEIGGKDIQPLPVKKTKAEKTKKKKPYGKFGKEFALISRMGPPEGEEEDDSMALESPTKATPKKKQSGKSSMNTSAKKRGQLYTSGALISSRMENSPNKKVMIQRPNDWAEEIYESLQIKKPSYLPSNIPQNLRQYHISVVKHFLDSNAYFEISGLDSLLLAKSLEKEIYEKFEENEMDGGQLFDKELDMLEMLLDELKAMELVSKKIRNRGFESSLIAPMIGKNALQLRKIEKDLKREMSTQNKNVDLSENMKEMATPTGKGSKSKSKFETSGRKKGLEELFKTDKTKKEEGAKKMIATNPDGTTKNETAFSDQGEEDLEGEFSKLEKVDAADALENAQKMSYDPETGRYEVSNEVEIEKYMYYRVFKGTINVETRERDSSKKIEDIGLYSCTGNDFIKYFTQIPDGLTLTCQLSLFEFEQYINKVLVSDLKRNYLVLPIWMQCSTPLATKNYFKAQGCVASMQYSKRCKVFVFPKEFLRQEWLSTLNFFIVKDEETQIELVGFVVLKLVQEGGYEVSILPEDQYKKETADKVKCFKYTKKESDTIETQMDLKILQEKSVVPNQGRSSNKKPKKKSRFFQDIVGFNKGPRGKKFNKAPASKLHRLMNNPSDLLFSPAGGKNSFKASTPSEAFRNDDSRSPSAYNSDLLNALKLPGSVQSPASNYRKGGKFNGRDKRTNKFRGRHGDRSTPQTNNSLLNMLGVPESRSPQKDDDQLSRLSSPLEGETLTDVKPAEEETDMNMLGKRVNQAAKGYDSFNDQTNILGKPLKKMNQQG